MANPVLHSRFHQMLRGTALVAVLCAAAWAIQGFIADQDSPQFKNAPQTGISEIADIPQEQASQPLSAEAFKVALWHAPTPPEQPKSTVAQRSTRVAFQLLAISTSMNEADKPVKYIVLYDPNEDKVHTLSIGQSINGYTVSNIQDDAVSLSQGTKTVRLELESGENG